MNYIKKYVLLLTKPIKNIILFINPTFRWVIAKKEIPDCVYEDKEILDALPVIYKRRETNG